MSAQPEKHRVLFIDFDEKTVAALSAELSSFEIIKKKYTPEVIENCLDPTIKLILCGAPPVEIQAIEVGQMLRMNYPDASIYYIVDSRQSFHRKQLQKNGFSDAYILPSDESVMNSTIKRDISKITSGQVKSFRSVQLIDLEPDSVLGFDVYIHLPANKRRIKYVSSSESLGDDRSAKLQKHHVQSVSVSEDQIHKFYEFTAQQLKRLGSNDKLSETEKKERREKAVRDVVSGLFNDTSKEDSLEHGRHMMSECQEIVKAYIMNPNDSKSSWVEKFMSVSNTETTAYSHAANTSTWATLISIALGIGNPQEIAMAALLHDIGLADVPSEICAKTSAERTPEEELKYQKHPEYSINLIKERRMVISEKIFKIIQQHHERYDGTGYPEKLPGPRICDEAQILAIADEIDEMTCIKEGRPRKTVPEAIDEICTQGLSNPFGSAFSPALLKSLKSIFLKKAA